MVEISNTGGRVGAFGSASEELMTAGDVGLTLGTNVGARDGLKVGLDVGAREGLEVGNVGNLEGLEEGANDGLRLGAKEGRAVGLVGLCVGCSVGLNVGENVGFADTNGVKVSKASSTKYRNPLSITVD